MQQGDLRIGGLDIQVIALRQIANGGAVAGHLRARLETIRHADRNLAAGTHHDRPVAQGVRGDGRQYPYIKVGLDDGSAAGQGIGSRAGRRGDHHPIAAVRIDETAIDGGLEIHGASGLPFVDHHIVQRQGLRDLAIVALQPRREQRTAILGVAAGQHRVDILEHGRGADVGEKS